jgi:hypothetical protein
MKSRRIVSGPVVVTAALAAGLMTAAPQARSEAQAAPAVAAERTVAQIVRERLKAAEDGLKLAEQDRQIGRSTSAGSAVWVLRKAHAAMDLPDKAERIAILQECATRMNQQIKSTEEMVRLGVAQISDVPLAKYDALEVEFLLAKARESR